MQRPIAAKAGLTGAISILLILPLFHSADAATPVLVSRQSPVAYSADANVPQRWRNYALASITPVFSWAPTISRSVPQITDTNDSLAGFAISLSALSGQSIGSLNLSIAQTDVDNRVQALSTPQLDVSAELADRKLKRTVVAPSFVSSFGSSGTFGVTAILAYQRFASLGLGETALNDGTQVQPLVPGETSYGAGLRLDAGDSLLNRLSWTAAYQSRVNMDALNSLRGVYSDPGQFDIPSSASVGLSYALTSALSFDVGAQRVMYSAVTPFTSPALPRRFLALLGSGASPVFAWQDLTVYSAGWMWRDDAIGNIELRYTTRQQPSPTSALLRNALNANPADHTVAFAYSRNTGRQSTLSLQAIYSSAPYFLGVPSYRSSDRITGSQLEYQAAWGMRF